VLLRLHGLDERRERGDVGEEDRHLLAHVLTERDVDDGAAGQRLEELGRVT